MNKFLITLAALAAFSLASVASADGHVKVSGVFQQVIGMGDDVDGGITEKFTRFGFAADTTTDNGWTVGGSFAMEVGNIAGGAGLSAYGPTGNSMYIKMDMATITIGNATNAVTNSVPRVSAMVPGGGTDNGFQFLFDGGLLGSKGVSFSEAYYAMSNSSVTITSASINGFTIAGTYAPDMGYNSADGIGRADQGDHSASHGESLHVGASYSADIEGLSYTIGAGIATGNSTNPAQSTVDGTTSGNNELAVITAAIKATMGNITMGASMYDNGDSWGNKVDAIKSSDSGYTLAMEYAMGSITVGAGYAHQELVRGTEQQSVATTLTAAAAGNTREDTVMYFGINYNMGGGVNTYAQLSNIDHSDGDSATVETDPQVLIAGISLGF